MVSVMPAAVRVTDVPTTAGSVTVGVVQVPKGFGGNSTMRREPVVALTGFGGFPGTTRIVMGGSLRGTMEAAVTRDGAGGDGAAGTVRDGGGPRRTDDGAVGPGAGWAEVTAAVLVARVLPDALAESVQPDTTTVDTAAMQRTAPTFSRRCVVLVTATSGWTFTLPCLRSRRVRRLVWFCRPLDAVDAGCQTRPRLPPPTLGRPDVDSS